MTIVKKLESMPYAQCHVEIDDNGIWFFSYKTLAANIDDDGWIEINCLCSQTTRKQVKAFCKEYAKIDDYSTIKTLYTNNEKMNINTGEIQ